jgi:mannose-6-phosphate isomerase-like protein (cupin superfamily)
MKKVIVVRKGEKVKTISLNGIIFNLLLKTDVLGVELSTFEPEASIGSSYRHIGQEVHAVLKGEMEFEIDGQKYLLKKGDVICFSSTLPHTLRNPGKEKAIFFTVNVPPTFM